MTLFGDVWVERMAAGFSFVVWPGPGKVMHVVESWELKDSTPAIRPSNDDSSGGLRH